MPDIANVWPLADPAGPFVRLRPHEGKARRKSLEEELAGGRASLSSVDFPYPSQMARRYRDLLNGEFERIASDAERAHSVGGIGADVGAVHA